METSTADYTQLPQITGVLISAGPFQLTWGALLMAVSLGVMWKLTYRRVARLNWDSQPLSELFLLCTLGALIGARLLYIFFYQFEYFLQHPEFLFAVSYGGWSAYGALLGGLVGAAITARRYRLSLVTLTDFVAPVLPVALGFGWLAALICGDLWGRTTDVSWAVQFHAAGPLPRHPVQLYAALTQGLLLFVVLYWYGSAQRTPGKMTGLFVIGFALSQLILGFFRQPDPQIGLIADYITLEQCLSVPILLFGLHFFLRAAKSVH